MIGLLSHNCTVSMAASCIVLTNSESGRVPSDQQLQIAVLLQNAQQTVFAEVMDVPKILMFHRSPECVFRTNVTADSV
jgi:hypothetical protein